MRIDPAPERSSDMDTGGELDSLANEFIERCRRGEAPSVSEYATRFPHLAGDIVELFPTLALVENIAGGELPPHLGPRDIRPEGPSRLGDYSIIREIGRGGMGVVYEAEQVSLGRRVALKVLGSRCLGDSAAVERFRVETQAVGRLQHSNIVPVYAVGEDGGTHYYAMQYVCGHSLADVIAELRRQRGDVELDGPAASTPGSTPTPNGSSSGLLGIRAGPSDTASSSVSESSSRRSSDLYFRNVARIGLQAASALSYAHGEGVLHRDIKPSNLLIDTRGTLWVTDFGLAKAEGGENLTSSGEILGTVAYMAPERFDGWSDPRSDVYSLGVTLYELATLRAAFSDSDRRRLIRRVLDEEPPRPSKLSPGVPRDLETIIVKAIGKDPTERYETAAGLRDDLQRFLEDRPIRARKMSTSERLLRWCRRNRAIAALAVSVAALVTTCAVGAFVYALHVESLRRDELLKLWDSYVAQARAQRLSGRPGRQFGSLEVLGEAAELGRGLGLGRESVLKIRNEYIACLALADLRSSLVRTVDGRVRFGPDLATYAVGSDGAIAIRRTSDGEELGRVSAEGTSYPLQFSDDGRFLAAYTEGRELRLSVYDLVEESAVVEMAAPRGHALDFLAGSRSAVVSLLDGTVAVIDLPSGERRRSLHVDMPPARRYLRVEPVSRRIAVSGSRELAVLDLESGATLERFQAPSHVYGLAWHPDGRHLATACSNYNVYLWDTADPRTAYRTLAGGHQGEVVWLEFHPDGLLVSSGWDGWTCVWSPFSGERLMKVEGRLNAFSTSGDRLGFVDGGWRMRICDVTTGVAACRTIQAHRHGSKGPNELSSSPDERVLAVACQDGVRLFDLRAARELAYLDIGSSSVDFAPESGDLVTSSPRGLEARSMRVVEREDGLAVELGAARRIGPRGEDFDRDTTGARFAIVRDHDVWVTGGTELAFPGASNATAPRWSNVALSPDGRYVASGSRHRRGVRVFDTRTGASLEIATEHPSHAPGVRFSPDGRWLVVSGGDAYRFFGAGTWELERTVETSGTTNFHWPIDFTRDGELMVLVLSMNSATLFETESGRPLATVTAPDDFVIRCIDISENGRFLATAGNAHAIQVWDLDHVRARLQEHGLDWE